MAAANHGSIARHGLAEELVAHGNGLQTTLIHSNHSGIRTIPRAVLQRLHIVVAPGGAHLERVGSHLVQTHILTNVLALAGIIDGDLEALVDILEVANKGQNPRVTRQLLDGFIDDENTDVDALFTNVLDFLRSANATKTTVAKLEAAIEQQKANN